ncbi:MAG: ATP-binding cassette domain-containing protein [Chloroflexia bacterium]
MANDGVSFSVARGEFTSSGENGAGKSTLMNILYGLYQPDEEQVLVNGTGSLRQPATPSRAASLVHQHFVLVPPLSVTENIALGAEVGAASSWTAPPPPRAFARCRSNTAST